MCCMHTGQAVTVDVSVLTSTAGDTLHVWKCGKTQLSRRVLSQRHTCSLSHTQTHTQTHIRGHSHTGAPPPTKTHTYTPIEREARWSHSMGCWPFRLTVSPPSFSNPFSSLPTYPPFPLHPLLALTSSLFSLRPFICSFCFANIMWLWFDCVEQIVHFTARQASFGVWLQSSSRRSGVITLWKSQLSQACSDQTATSQLLVLLTLLCWLSESKQFQ